MHLLKWLYPGMKFKRWLLLFSVGVMLVSLGLALVFNYKYLDVIEEAIFRAVYLWKGSYNYMFTTLAGIAVVIVGVGLMLIATRFVIRSVITVLLPDNSERLVDIIYEKRRLGKAEHRRHRRRPRPLRAPARHQGRDLERLGCRDGRR